MDDFVSGCECKLLLLVQHRVCHWLLNIDLPYILHCSTATIELCPEIETLFSIIILKSPTTTTISLWHCCTDRNRI